MNTNKLICATVAVLSIWQAVNGQKPGWQHLDPQRDSVMGMSTQRAYAELLKGKKPVRVIVGIIDTGIDTAQEDLKDVIWKDPDTGIAGWDLIGGETGQEDITHLVGKDKAFYDSLVYTPVPEQYRAGYQQHRKLMPVLEGKINAMKAQQAELEAIAKLADRISMKIGKPNPTMDDLRNYKPNEEGDEILYMYGTPDEKGLLQRILRRMQLYPDWKAYRYNEIDHILYLIRYHLSHGLNINNDEADTARGDADITPDKIGPIGDPNIGGSYHGTHVAGIIGAVRGNGIGLDGVADDVWIMMLKENGTLREMRDEALARAIRWAVDHGAKVINLSFGKPYTWNKKLVDEAVKYAMKKDVLLIHAAGNGGEDLDKTAHYPNPVYADGSGRADAWLEVGASGAKDDSTLAAKFSNYSKREVDVFAPGVDIYSTLPYNQYDSWEGTSMAAPMVTGLAALIREYYPTLKAVQVKRIIMESVVRRPALLEKCVSGGVVNTYNALKLAANYSSKSIQ